MSNYWEETEKDLRKEYEDVKDNLVFGSLVQFKRDKQAHEKELQDQHAEDVHYYLNQIQEIKEKIMNILSSYYFFKLIDKKGNTERVSINKIYDEIEPLFLSNTNKGGEE